MISAAELAVQTEQTKAFIAADVEEIVFRHPGERIRNTATGGFTDVAPSVSPVQHVRMIPQADKVVLAKDTAGTREAPEYILAGLPSADFRKGDTFEWRGQTWAITAVHDKPDYIRKGDVILKDG